MSCAVPVFPPQALREYAVLADGERGALLGPRGDVVWMCAPRWHDDAVFSSLIGGSGVYSVTPADARYVWGGRYEPGSLIWRSRWVTTSSIIECREALAYPGDPRTAVLLRRVEATSGAAPVRAVLGAAAGFGQDPMKDVVREGATWTARSGPLYLRWSGAPDAVLHEDGWLDLTLELPAGQHHDLVLEVSDSPLRTPPPDPGRAWSATEHAWRTAVPEIEGTLADQDVRQSYAVLRGMTSSTGAMVAAATMSLPERADQGRNYDYRYAWIRDQCFAGQAVAACGVHPLLDDAVRFVAARLLDHGPDLRPAYTVTGARVPAEHPLDLPGYPGGQDKTGNWVNDQLQLDNFGEALLLFATAARHDRLDVDDWRAAEVAARAIEQRWTEPDAGIWELHNARWTHSRLMCVAGLRAMSEAAPAAQGAGWVALADRITADTARDGLHPSGRWQRALDDAHVDAALLLPGIRGAVSHADPRSVATAEAVRRDLTQDGYVYRFRHGARPLGEAEGAFTLCGFLMAITTHEEGDALGALRWFERNRAACSTSGLFTEEYDVAQRQLRGNYPQAFVHALLIESASRIASSPPGTDAGSRNHHPSIRTRGNS